MMNILSEKNTARTLVTALVLSTISVTTASPVSICPTFDGDRGSCDRQVGECYWDVEDSKCLHIFTWEECYDENLIESQCQHMGCSWNKDVESCFMPIEAMARPLFLDEDEEPPFETRPFFLDEDEDFPSGIDRDVKPQQLTRPLFPDEDEERLDEDEDEEPLFETRPFFLDEDEEFPSGIDRDVKPEHLTRPLFPDEDEESLDKDSDMSDNFNDEEFRTRPLFIDEDVEEDNDRSSIGRDEVTPETRPIYIDEYTNEDVDVDVEEDESVDEDADEDIDQDESVDEDVDESVDEEESVDEDVDEDIDEGVDEDKEEDVDEVESTDEDVDESVNEDVDERDVYEDEGPYVYEDEDPSRPIYINEDVDEDNDRSNNVDENRETDREAENSRFWKNLRGKGIRNAKVAIKERFGDEYHVYVCRKRKPRAECMAKDIDDTRVRLWVRQNRRVKKVVFG